MTVRADTITANREPVPLRLRVETLARTNWTCFYCGYEATYDADIRQWINLQVDHVVPRWTGGLNDPRNLVASCRSCNGSKGPTIPPADVVRWAGELFDLIPTPDVEIPTSRKTEPTPWREKTGRPIMRPRRTEVFRGWACTPRQIQCPDCPRWLELTGQVIVCGGEVGVIYVMACYWCKTEWEVDADGE